MLVAPESALVTQLCIAYCFLFALDRKTCTDKTSTMAPTVAKLPPEKIGKNFLAASHYRVGMDDAFLEVAQIFFSIVRLNA